MSSTAVITSRKSRKLTLTPEWARRNARLLRNLDAGLPISTFSEYSSLVHYAPSANEPVHRWFPYREGYSTQLVVELIKNHKNIETVFDPFCGCGTTLVAAQNLGLKSYGLDVSPLAVLVTRAKTRHYSFHDLKSIATHIAKIRDLKEPTQAPWKPALKIIDTVFHPRILASLTSAKQYVDAIHDEAQRDFLLTGWLSILEDVSNVYKEGNGIKYRNRRRTPEGYIAIPMKEWQKTALPANKHEFVLTTLSKQLQTMLDDAEERDYRKLGGAHVIEGSATEMKAIPPNSIDFCVFSPPYCNCFNYFKAFKIELWMGGFVRSYSDIRELNSRAMRSHVETRLRRGDDEPIELVERFVQLIPPAQLWDKRIPDAVRGYFTDMRRVLCNLRTVLRRNALCVMVVGNSAYAGILVPTDAIIASIATSIGFKIEQVGVARHLTTSSQQKLLLEDRKAFLRESLIILRKAT